MIAVGLRDRNGRRFTALSQISDWHAPTNLVEAPLADHLIPASDAFSKRADAADVSFVFRAETGPARLDPLLVTQAVTNLLDNALSHGRRRKR
jgi:signal transduction histidine kinase